MSGIKITWQVSERYNGVLLREYLRTEQELSKKALAEIKFSGGALYVNGKEATVRKLLVTGDQITVIFPPEQRSETMVATRIPLDIIYEDDHFLLINKQANLTTIPSREQPHYSLANGVLQYYNNIGVTSTFHAVNRLDKDTSGLVMIAKHRYAHDLLSRQRKKQMLSRRYLAVVHGQVRDEIGTINDPIGRKDNSIIEREVRSDGQPAITHYSVIRRLQVATVVRVKLETGRTHQIRVHFSSIGHPLCGDDLYGGGREQIRRQALHSHQLTFYHPFQEETLTFTAPLPADLEALLSEA
ncbi:RluA family pseudouridine synthase [Desertibacillus haloalkaliphilus]|uniref:RluA family pseudouridine synthase n=1 Tax=Desertibacillus haloalkaliphilus TaxID=1328930 RepID=UPI001C26E622|nr:RluA family pseudouridine synthase [Desertibacillus haloalkaliphilus]MBU8906902.1 RluA family pseudouridine synthase [Desertibacillus haloalkaliphilus]